MSKSNEKQRFSSIGEIAEYLKENLFPHDKKRLILLYAFNSTGKTRLSVKFEELNENEYGRIRDVSFSDKDFGFSVPLGKKRGTLRYSSYQEGFIKTFSYNAFFEDLFTWNNEKLILEFDSQHWIIELIVKEGLETAIYENFRDLTRSKVEPRFNWSEGTVSFQIAKGDEEVVENVKISRSEESFLIWVIYFSILEIAIETLNQEREDRSTEVFDDLEYIVIDDPVSSIDDERIISLAVRIVHKIDESKNPQLNFLVTTHHPLFFNVLFNEFRRRGYSRSYILSRDEYSWYLEQQNNDSPFAYHILIIEKMREAIESNSLEKYHFNLFRTLLEKTANFLGYSKWGDLLEGVVGEEEDRKELIRTINNFSHSKVSELESRKLEPRHEELLRRSFEKFVEEFKFNSEIWEKKTEKEKRV